MTYKHACLGLFILVTAIYSQARGIEPDLEERLRGIEERLKAMQEKPRQTDRVRVYWKEGLRLETADRVVQLRFGGRLMNDWAFMIEDDNVKAVLGDIMDGTEIRQAWQYVSGLLYNRVEFKAQFGFTGGDAEFRDVYLGLRKLPIVGNVQVGHFKEPFGLEELTSRKYISFMERSLPNVFRPGWNTGIMLYNHELQERLTWTIGLFFDTNNFGERIVDGEYNVTSRITGLLWYGDKGRKLFHLGTAYSHRNPSDQELGFRERPEAHLAPWFVNTEKFPADFLGLIGVETALVLGSGSLQGEYIHASVDRPANSNTEFSGFYMIGSYFLTGEHRPYNPSSAKFGLWCLGGRRALRPP